MAKKTKQLTTIERARCVVRSQGKPITLLDCRLAAYVEEIAKLCNEAGQVHANAPLVFEQIYYKAHKATAESHDE